MKAPYLDLPQQYKNQKKELDFAFKRVMTEGSFILRKDVERFEKDMASYIGVKHVIGVNSGTDALFLSLKSLDLKPKDEVITTALLPYTIFAILNAGAKPVLIDVKEDFNMDVDKIEKAITSKTKAIMPIHLNGRSCQMDKIMKIARKNNLIVIEDSAQSLGSKYKGKKTGTFGILGCFSLHPMKNLSCAGDGGFIATNNNDFAKKLRTLRNLGKYERTIFKSFGYNSRLDNLQAAILNVKLRNLNKYIKKRMEIAIEYNEGLSNLPLILPKISKEDTYNSYVIFTKDQKGLFNYLTEKRIEVFLHYSAPVYKLKELNLKDFNLPKTEQICREAISLPINPSMNDMQISYVIKSINDYFK